MVKVKIYSRKTRRVHHNNIKCTERNNIEKENIVDGDGGLPLCLNCKKLNKKEKK